jgi:hypothetical protein
MNALMNIEIQRDIRTNPRKTVEMICQLASEIDECKDDLTEIKSRGFFKKVFSSNTNDLAGAMLKQSDSMSLFLQIIQKIIVLNIGNTAALVDIYQQLCKHEGARGAFQNKYLEMAKEFISESLNMAIEVHGKIEKIEVKINELRNHLIEKNKLDEEQSRLIAELKKGLKAKEKIDAKQHEIIASLKKSLREKDCIDEEQTKLINLLENRINKKDEVDEQQTKTLQTMEKILINLEKQFEGFTLSFEKIQLQFIEKDKTSSEYIKKFRLWVTGYCAVMTVILIYLCSLVIH